MEPDKPFKYVAFTPATWLLVIQLLMLHWKIAYNLALPWWAVVVPLELAGVVLVVAGIVSFVGRIITVFGSKWRSKPFS